MRQTDFVILGLLSETPLSGYQIKKYIDGRFHFFWNESYGQLYPALKSLVNQGLITETPTDPIQRRARRTYAITSAGLEQLRQWLQLPVERESVRLEVLLKMYFSHLIDPAVMSGHVRRFQQVHAADLQILQLYASELQAIPDRDPNHRQVLRVIDFGVKVNQAYLDWCRETLEFLEGRKTP